MSDKVSLRSRFSTLRGLLPPSERRSAEAAVRDKLFSLPSWKDARLICGYVSIGSELDMDPIWKQAVSEGKAYALPVTLTGAREGRMIFRRLSGYTPHELTSARFGLSEPTAACPSLTLQDFAGALILIPGLAFDDEGYRIGYGGGYYDRFLASLVKADIPVTTVGLTFSVCHAAHLPSDPHDIPVDCVLDERRITVTHGTRVEHHKRGD